MRGRFLNPQECSCPPGLVRYWSARVTNVNASPVRYRFHQKATNLKNFFPTDERTCLASNYWIFARIYQDHVPIRWTRLSDCSLKCHRLWRSTEQTSRGRCLTCRGGFACQPLVRSWCLPCSFWCSWRTESWSRGWEGRKQSCRTGSIRIAFGVKAQGQWGCRCRWTLASETRTLSLWEQWLRDEEKFKRVPWEPGEFRRRSLESELWLSSDLQMTNRTMNIPSRASATQIRLLWRWCRSYDDVRSCL